MTDIYEVIIVNDPLECLFTDDVLEVIIQEDNYSLVVDDAMTEVLILNENIEVVTIAEQGPSGVFGIAIGNTAPTSPAIGDLWLDTN